MALKAFKIPGGNIDWCKVRYAANGNPRYVCSWLNFTRVDDTGSLFEKKAIAEKRAAKIGGRPYRGKNYGGGIVFQSFNLAETEQAIADLD